jgi:hypothetical protein
VVLLQFGELLTLEPGAGPTATASKFAGGELRLEKGGSLTFVALAAPVTGSTSVKVGIAVYPSPTPQTNAVPPVGCYSSFRALSKI